MLRRHGAGLCRAAQVPVDEARCAVERGIAFVEHRREGLEDVGHVGRDVERDLHVGMGGVGREADRVVEQDLARAPSARPSTTTFSPQDAAHAFALCGTDYILPLVGEDLLTIVRSGRARPHFAA